MCFIQKYLENKMIQSLIAQAGAGESRAGQYDRLIEEIQRWTLQPSLVVQQSFQNYLLKWYHLYINYFYLILFSIIKCNYSVCIRMYSDSLQCFVLMVEILAPVI